MTARSVKRASAAGGDADLCAPDTLSHAKAAGKIVVCDRGVVDRVDKSAEVKRVGGKGMVLVNLTENSTDGDTHAVPTVHLNVPFGPAVKKYAKKSGATATLREGNLSSTPSRYPQITSFSSRGPSVGNGGDLLKPDIAAPGVSVLAAVAPPSNDEPKVRLLLRHLDGLAPYRRYRSSLLRRTPEVVAHGGEVRDHDHGVKSQEGQWQSAAGTTLRRVQATYAPTGCSILA